MKTRRTRTIGVVVADLANPFYPEVLDELTRSLDAAGFRVVVWNSGKTGNKDAIKAIGEAAVDGVVFATATGDSSELRAASDVRRPIVLINRIVEGVECDRVSSDNADGGASVADFFLENGRTDVAFISGDEQAATSRDRQKGFLQRMAHLGYPVPEHLRVAGGFSHDRTEQATRRLLSRSPHPRAIFCANDFMALGALDARQEMGVPAHQCWIVGYDDIAMASWPSFSLTTVRQPSREMASVGARLLLERIEDPSLPPRDVRFASALVVRGSTPLTPATPGGETG